MCAFEADVRLCTKTCVSDQHCATLLSSSVVVHVSAHLVNVVNFSVSYSDDFPALNVARYRGEVRREHIHIHTLHSLVP